MLVNEFIDGSYSARNKIHITYFRKVEARIEQMFWKITVSQQMNLSE